MGMAMSALAFAVLPVIHGAQQLYLVVGLFSIGEAAVATPMMALLTESVSPLLYGETIGLYGEGEDVGNMVAPY